MCQILMIKIKILSTKWVNHKKLRIHKHNLFVRDVLQLMVIGVALLMVKSVMVVMV